MTIVRRRAAPIPPSLSDDEAADLLRLHGEGWHEWELSNRFKISLATVDALLRGYSYKHVKGKRLTRKTGFMTLEKAKLAMAMRARGWGNAKIANSLSVGVTSVKRALSGVPNWSRLWAKRSRANRIAKQRAAKACAEK